ncbi:unnamed protein product [Dibothriocephalus latus]|uniref:Uncharacterized protein n=1 Tax=Dibothriocephalus latus TaxID=60516 RepID=A0A3P7PZL8_DIBLA|nr:unnamed protein product [Dibothriocephalus latus]
MSLVERSVRLPALREVHIPTTGALYDRASLENGVSFAGEISFSDAATSSDGSSVAWTAETIQIGRWAPLVPKARALMLELTFFPDNPTPTSEVSSALLFVSQFGHLVEKLVITVCPSTAPESLTDVDPELESVLVRHRAQFYSVKTCFIKSPVSFTFCNSAIWHSCHCLRNIPHSEPMKNICGLFPGLEDLIITSDSHLDPEDLGEVPIFCPMLRRLFLHKWPYSLYQYSQIIQEILSTSKLEVLCLIMRLDVGQQRREPSSFCPELYGVIWREEKKMKHPIDQWCHL